MSDLPHARLRFEASNDGRLETVIVQDAQGQDLADLSFAVSSVSLIAPAMQMMTWRVDFLADLGDNSRPFERMFLG